MKSNFDFLDNTEFCFPIGKCSKTAEQYVYIHVDFTLLLLRKVLELSIRWVYDCEEHLDVYRSKKAKLDEMLNNHVFKQIAGPLMVSRLNTVRLLGNSAAHEAEEHTFKEGLQGVENVFMFLVWICNRYLNIQCEEAFDIELVQEAALRKEEVNLGHVMCFISMRSIQNINLYESIPQKSSIEELLLELDTFELNKIPQEDRIKYQANAQRYDLENFHLE